MLGEELATYAWDQRPIPPFCAGRGTAHCSEGDTADVKWPCVCLFADAETPSWMCPAVAHLRAHPVPGVTGLNAVIKKKAVSRPSLSQVQTNLHAMALDAAGPGGGPGGPEHGFAGAHPHHAQHPYTQPHQQHQQHPPPPYQQHAQHAAPPKPGPAAGLAYGQAYQGQAPQQQYVGMGMGVQ